MLLEKYVDLGILFAQLIARAEAGERVTLDNGRIKIGETGAWAGSDGVKYTSAVFADALNLLSIEREVTNGNQANG